MYFLFHNEYRFSNGPKIKPFSFKDKKMSGKTCFLSDIIDHNFKIRTLPVNSKTHFYDKTALWIKHR
ncbi:hypothetical protein BXU10_23690 [Flavobacterium sp. LM4]|nr:hypothetical protein BXU10_23690 [Flavobacterium sp. LM4]